MVYMKGQKGKKTYKKKKKIESVIDTRIKNYEKKHVELKWYGAGNAVAIATYAAAAFAAAGTWYTEMTTVGQGVLDNQRVGDQLNLVSVEVKASIFHTIGAGTNYFNYIRCIVFQKTQNSAVNAPTANEIFNADAITGVISTYGNRNIDYLNEYKVLYDKVFTLINNNSGTAQSNPDKFCKFLHFFVPMKYCKRRLHFQGAASTTANNALYIMFTSNNVNNGAGNPFCQADWRLRFTDA